MDRVFRALPFQPEENPANPNSITWIYILSKIGYVGEFSECLKYGYVKKYLDG